MNRIYQIFCFWLSVVVHLSFQTFSTEDVNAVLRPLAIHPSYMVVNRSDRNISPWKFTQWVWCLFVSWQYSFSRSHPGPAQQEVKQARPSPLHISPAVRIMSQKTSHTLFILTRYKHWALHSAAYDPSVSQYVFTITEKAPTRAVSRLEAPTCANTFKTLLRHYAKQALTPSKYTWNWVPNCDCTTSPINR